MLSFSSLKVSNHAWELLTSLLFYLLDSTFGERNGGYAKGSNKSTKCSDKSLSAYKRIWVKIGYNFREKTFVYNRAKAFLVQTSPYKVWIVNVILQNILKCLGGWCNSHKFWYFKFSSAPKLWLVLKQTVLSVLSAQEPVIIQVLNTVRCFCQPAMHVASK